MIQQSIIPVNRDVSRSFDAAHFNDIARDPDVRPWLGGCGDIDLSPLVIDPLNFCFKVDGGGFIVARKEPGIYEVHSLFSRNARSRSVRAMRSALEYMFTRTDCIRLVTQIPDDNKAAHGLALLGGFREIFRLERGFRGPTSYQALDLDRWIASCASLGTVGHDFHDFLERGKASAGSSLPVHEDEPAHDRHVGAAILMARNGNSAKAVASYNRWARLANYAQVSLISQNPPVIDVVDAIVTIDASGELEMVQCR